MNDWKNKRVLVTGAGGFIGSHLSERLVEAGADVRAFLHYNALGRHGWLDSSSHHDAMEIIAGDICDRDAVRNAVRGVDVVFHLAALIGIPYSYVAPASYVRTNVEGTLNVLQEARDAGTTRVLHTSTSEVYGSALKVPISESHPLQGQSPYSASKIAADKMVEAFHLSFDLPVVTIRPFNTFGPRQSCRAVIPTIITQGLSGKKMRLGSLHPTRDMNFVENTVQGYLLAAQADDVVGETINLGSGREISIGDLVKVIAQALGSEIEIEVDAARIRPGGSEVERLLADNTLANDLLGWTPGVDLEEGLRRTIEWIRENLDLIHANVYSV